MLPKSATEYFRQNCWVGVSQPGSRRRRRAWTTIGVDRFMWGTDYPHEEGTGALHPRAPAPALQRPPPRRCCDGAFGGNAAELYGFDLDTLAPLAEKVGPTVGEMATPLDRLPDQANEALTRV